MAVDAFNEEGHGVPIREPEIDTDADWKTQLTKGCRLVAVVDEIERRALAAVEESRETARAEGERIIAAAKAEIEQEVNRAREQLRAQVAVLAVTGAEKILRREVDAKAHAQLLQSLEAELR